MHFINWLDNKKLTEQTELVNELMKVSASDSRLLLKNHFFCFLPNYNIIFESEADYNSFLTQHKNEVKTLLDNMSNYFFEHYKDGVLDYSHKFNLKLKEFLDLIEAERDILQKTSEDQKFFKKIARWYLVTDFQIYEFFSKNDLSTVQFASSYWVCIFDEQHGYPLQDELFKELNNIPISNEVNLSSKVLFETYINTTEKGKILRAMKNFSDKEVIENFDSIIDSRIHYSSIKDRVIKKEKGLNDWDRDWHPLRESYD